MSTSSDQGTKASDDRKMHDVENSGGYRKTEDGAEGIEGTKDESKFARDVQDGSQPESAMPVESSNGMTPKPEKSKKQSKFKEIWTKIGLDVPTVLMMFK